MDLSHVLWIGGGRGTGKSAIARALSDRFDLRLYTVDDHDQTHQLRLPRSEPGVSPDATPAELVESFVTLSRHRFRLVLEDLAGLPPSPLAIVEGTQLFPTSVAAVLRDPRHALFLIPDLDGQPAATFDVLVAQRFAWEARDLRLTTLVGGGPIDELVERAAAQFLPVISAARDTSQ